MSKKTINRQSKYRHCVEPMEGGLLSLEWMNSKEASQYLSITPGALRNLVYRRQIPFYRFGRRIRFRLKDLQTLITNNRIGIGEWENAS